MPGRLVRGPFDRETVVAWFAVAVVTAYVAWQMHPELLLRNSTPTLGDLGAHLHEPAHLRENLLPQGRLSGWSQDWFTGYPSLTFYFPFGSLLVVLFDLLVPYNVALKVVAALGPITLPLAAYVFGRLNGCDRLVSAGFGVVMLPLLLEPNLVVAGGSIGSAAVGEYSYGLSFSLGLVVVGLARRGMRTGRGRALTACLLAATVLLHLLPGVMTAACIVVSAAVKPTWARIRWSTSVFAVGAGVVGFWAVPFLVREPFTAGPAFSKSGPLLDVLFSVGMAPVAVVAAIGVVVALLAAAAGVRKWEELDTFLLAMAGVSGFVVAVVPNGRVWNMRFLAFWFLWLCLLAGRAFVEAARAVDEARKRAARGGVVASPKRARFVLPLVLFLAVVPLWDSRLARGVLTGRQFDVVGMAKLSFEGYERSRYRDEFQDFIDTIRRIAREHGCGRAHWEYEEDDGGSASFRQPLMQLMPYWTDGCIGTTNGLFTQSSATGPFINLSNTRLSATPAVVDDQRPFDVDAGVADLRVLGVRYFVAVAPQTIKAADASSKLRRVAETGRHEGRFWKIYEVPDTSVVAPLDDTPVVVRGLDRSRTHWETSARTWYDTSPRTVVAADGPDRWPRSDSLGDLARPPTSARAEVGRVEIRHNRISFDVSRTGTPVLVKVAYFPNWKASGARGPWRVMPNQMVVVPTSKTVVLRYGHTAVDHVGRVVSVVGLGGLVLLARRGAMDMPVVPEPPTAERGRTGRNPSKRRKKRR